MQVNSSVRLSTSIPGVGYTLKHRNAVKQLINHFCSNAVGKVDGNGQVFTSQDYKIMRNRAHCHDMDKVLTSLAYPQLTADYFHRMFNGHHIESFIEPANKNKYDWMEMIFDMESAKYTKPDKAGGGAFDFCSKYRENVLPYMMPYFQLFGLDKPDTGFVESIKDDCRSRQFYESDLIDEILEYIHCTHLHQLEYVSRVDDAAYMSEFGGIAPYRHPIEANGTVYNRPSEVCYSSKSMLSHEMVHGSFEAQLYDMDSLCLIPSSELGAVNAQVKQAVDHLSEKWLQR